MHSSLMITTDKHFAVTFLSAIIIWILVFCNYPLCAELNMRFQILCAELNMRWAQKIDRDEFPDDENDFMNVKFKNEIHIILVSKKSVNNSMKKKIRKWNKLWSNFSNKIFSTFWKRLNFSIPANSSTVQCSQNTSLHSWICLRDFDFYEKNPLMKIKQIKKIQFTEDTNDHFGLYLFMSWNPFHSTYLNKF